MEKYIFFRSFDFLKLFLLKGELSHPSNYFQLYMILWTNFVLVKHKKPVTIRLNLFNIKNCLSDVHLLLCLKSNAKYIISDLPFLGWHLTIKIRYLALNQVHSVHGSDCTVFYTDMRCKPVSSLIRTTFSCLTFDHACYWSLGMEGISVRIEYEVCQFGMFKINSKFRKVVDFFALQTR